MFGNIILLFCFSFKLNGVKEKANLINFHFQTNNNTVSL